MKALWRRLKVAAICSINNLFQYQYITTNHYPISISFKLFIHFGFVNIILKAKSQMFPRSFQKQKTSRPFVNNCEYYLQAKLYLLMNRHKV